MNIATESLLALYTRDLDKLASEINLYASEEAIWKVRPGIANSGGNLCLHLCGNLQHFIGTILGKSSYLRNREAEFADKNIPRKTLIEEIERTKASLKSTLTTLEHDQLHSQYPIDVFGRPMTTLYFLMHLATHLGYHLGQVNYHRRLVG